MDEIAARLKRLLIEDLHFDELSPDQIGLDDPLFGPTGLGLDSVDALELVLEVERQFGVAIADDEEARKVLGSVGSLARYIHSHA